MNPILAQVIEFSMGATVIGILLDMRYDLGGIKAVMEFLSDGHKDHEQRIRGLESRDLSDRGDDGRPA